MNAPGVIALATALLLAGGCSSAIESGTSTLLDGDDLIRVTDSIAQELGSSDAVLAEVERNGRLIIVVRPVRNRLTGEVIPTSAGNAFTSRVRTLLSKKTPERFVWVNNRDAFYDVRARELEGVEPGPAPEAVSPEYALTATFTSLTREDGEQRSLDYLTTYELVNLDERTTLWAGDYLLSKQSFKNFLD